MERISFLLGGISLNFIKKCFTVVLAAVSILTAGCGDEPAAKNKSDLVAVSLPVKFPERWREF